MGTGSHLVYPFQNGQYAKSPNTGDAIISKWLATDSTMNFNVFLNSVPSSTATTPSSTVGGIQTPYNYNTLPPGYTWTNETDTASGDVYHYVVNDGSGYHIAVGPDSIFYRYNRGGDYHLTAADLTSKWTPPLNTNPIFTGGSQPYTGVASTVYLWQWYYLCLDSSSGVGKFYRPVMRVNPTQDGVGISVPATGGTSLTQTWSGPPGPKNTTGVTVLYGNISVGLTDYATPAPAFVGANVMGDGVNLGVSYGGPAPANASYIGYQKRVTGHYCIYAASSTGAVQFLRIPFQLIN